MKDEKAVYTAPELIVHGDIAEITQQNLQANFQDLLGAPICVGSDFHHK